MPAESDRISPARSEKDASRVTASGPPMRRREALAKLGLGAAAVYAAPTILHLDRSANAVQPSCTGKGKGKGNPWCTASRPPESNRP
ncbi:MAG: hypothetical protein WD470_01650 [Rhodospirillaceae bacterium]